MLFLKLLNGREQGTLGFSCYADGDVAVRHDLMSGRHAGVLDAGLLLIDTSVSSSDV